MLKFPKQEACRRSQPCEQWMTFCTFKTQAKMAHGHEYCKNFNCFRQHTFLSTQFMHTRDFLTKVFFSLMIHQTWGYGAGFHVMTHWC